MEDYYDEGYTDATNELREEYRDTARTAIAQIQRGDTLDAITTLEREFFPKWVSVEASLLQYELAVKAALGEPAGEVG